MKTAFIVLGGAAVLALLATQTEKGAEVVEEIKAVLPGAFGRSVTSGKGAQYYAEIESIGASYGLPANLLSRVAYQESRFNPAAKNAGSGALGMFQIVPRWHPTAEPLDWRKAADYAAGYLTQLYRQFGTWSKALAAYNWGPGNVSKYGLSRAPTETENYYKQIMADIGLQAGIA
jgi:soluble lytic murein transglycosylase-like protein